MSGGVGIENTQVELNRVRQQQQISALTSMAYQLKLSAVASVVCAAIKVGFAVTTATALPLFFLCHKVFVVVIFSFLSGVK